MGGITVCQAENPTLITLPESRVFVLKCNTYLKRDPGDFLQPICLNVDSSGLFPGQLKPPIDYTDFDPDATAVEPQPTPVVKITLGHLMSEETSCDIHMPTKEVAERSCIFSAAPAAKAVEPECDT
jgi:hypothetical protein